MGIGIGGGSGSGWPPAWLWDAGAWCGVADTEAQAMERAETYIGATGTATVEMARFADRGWQTVYERTGVGITGKLRNGRVSWVPLKRAAAA